MFGVRHQAWRGYQVVAPAGRGRSMSNAVTGKRVYHRAGAL